VFEQGAGGLLERLVHQCVSYESLGDGTSQAIGAEQHAIAWLEDHLGGVGDHAAMTPQAARHDLALRVDFGVFRVKLPGVYQFLHVAMVVRNLLECFRSPPQHVCPAITDVGHVELVSPQHGGNGGGAHSGAIIVTGGQ
jgi:hypothetical protein